MAIQNLYPALRPSLDLNFAGSKTVDPRITFTRASSASYFDEFGVMRTASNNVPRIDHNPITGECLGLLLEEQRTNLVPHSEQFDNANWAKSQVTITPNAIVAPDGTLTADLLIEDTSNAQHSISRGQSLLANTTYTMYVYVKPAGRTLFRMAGSYIDNWSVSSPRADFDLTAGTVSSLVGVNAGIQSVGDGWYRCHLTATFGAADNLGGINILPLISSSGSIYQGDGTSGIYIWGAQLEVGAFPTSYIKTEASQVTRASDLAEMTGANFSSWYRQDEGTFVLDYVLGQKLASMRLITTRDFAGTSFIEYIAGAGVFPTVSQGTYIYSVIDSVARVAASGSAITNTPNARRVFAGAYKLNDYGYCNNGNAVTVDTDATVPVAQDRLYFSSALNANSSLLCGHIRRIAYYPRRLSNGNLIALTT